MHWRDPHFFWLIPAVLALGALLVVLLRRRAAALAAFAEAALVARLTPDLDGRRPWWRAALRVAALVLIALALAGPKWGFHWQQMKREGIDLIVALDTSRSMLATDVKPNRLERAKLAVLDLLPLLQGDRVGLVAFAGTAFLECPLTLDYAAFGRSLHSLAVGIIPRGGTALARAIDASLEGFEARQGRYEALILITDGEDHEGDVKAAAARAAERSVKIFTVGIGTSQGELLPLGADGFVKDRGGRVVKSRLNDTPLKEIALATGGAYVQGLGPSLGLDEVFRDHIATMERREVASALERRYEERFQLPLAVALLALVLESLVPLRREARTGRANGWRRFLPVRAQTAAALALVLCLPLLVGWLDPPADHASHGNQLYADRQYEAAASQYGEGLIDAPGSVELQFNLATALYKQEKYADAIQTFEKVAASGEPTWIARAAYNAGNARYRLGASAEQSDAQAALASWEAALADYKRAMVADPDDTDAKFNHEFVERKIAELKQKLEDQAKQQQQEQQQQQQGDEEQQQQQEQQQQRDQQQAQQQDQQQEAEEQQQGGQPEQQAQAEPQPREGQRESEPRSEEQPGAEPPPQPASDEQEQPPSEQARQQPAPAEPSDADAKEGSPGGGTAVEAAPRSPEERAARAVLDTARNEELSPLDIERPVGAAGVGDPAQDW
ncbi:MAG: VWA domain-containing protein [Candidatus Binatia bacterium]